MIGDTNNFLKFKEDRGGNVFFGDNGSSKILGKGMVSLGNKKAKVENVLFVEIMKHKLLNISQMCYQGHTLTFDSRKCKIRNRNTKN